uniref:Mutator family transposase n=1 Tax=Leptospirillum sp. Group II '5-way CG' TaxID=419541 RepID=B6AKY1_9BACT|nr:MAG: transposase [Leptospirillum sp. Group II '5-way CG']
MKKLVESVLNQVLEAQMVEHLGADRHERSSDRTGYRNGYRERQLTTRVGTLVLRVPQTRDGHFSTDLFRRYQRSEQALVLALMEMVVQGVSTRKVTHITEELCGAQFSKSTVSSLATGLSARVNHWRNRRLTGPYPFLLLDALVIHVRKDDSVVPVAALIATGVSEEGQREILGLTLGDSENEASWDDMLRDLKSRGLCGVDLVVSDDHKGLKKAVQRHFQGFDGNDARCIFSGIFWVMRRPPNEGPWHWPWDACSGRTRKKKPEPSRTRFLRPLRRKLPSRWIVSTKDLRNPSRFCPFPGNIGSGSEARTPRND